MPTSSLGIGFELDLNGLLDQLRDAERDRIIEQQTKIERATARYRQQFSQIDAMTAQMNQASDYLIDQFSSLKAQINRSK